MREDKFIELERDEKAAFDSANLVKRLNLERKEREERLHSKSKKMKLYWDEQLNNMELRKQYDEQELIQKKHYIADRIEQIKLRSQARKKANVVSKKVIKELMDNRPD